jgi:Family of unknown function (DUF5343)
MSLSNAYVLNYGQLAEVFRRIAEGQAPDKFTVQYLKDLGFTSSNYRAVIPLLKTLGFLTPDGIPTNRYLEYRNPAQSRRVMGDAVHEAYGDLFTIKANPTESDFDLIEGKFRSALNATTNTSKYMASTFYALLELADTETPVGLTEPPKVQQGKLEERNEVSTKPPASPHVAVSEKAIGNSHSQSTALHYNIQIHLPATKDVEVFNAIFKSLREHLLD